jgi:hypothetical protein
MSWSVSFRGDVYPLKPVQQELLRLNAEIREAIAASG